MAMLVTAPGTLDAFGFLINSMEVKSGQGLLKRKMAHFFGVASVV